MNGRLQDSYTANSYGLYGNSSKDFGCKTRENNLSHNNHRLQCNVAITNCLISDTYKMGFHDVIGQSTVPVYSYAKISKHG